MGTRSGSANKDMQGWLHCMVINTDCMQIHTATKIVLDRFLLVVLGFGVGLGFEVSVIRGKHAHIYIGSKDGCPIQCDAHKGIPATDIELVCTEEVLAFI